jgi:hypothetical protein
MIFSDDSFSSETAKPAIAGHFQHASGESAPNAIQSFVIFADIRLH